MAIFSKHSDELNDNSKASAETTVIASGAIVKGELSFMCRLHVDGLVEGSINSNNLIVIGKKGKIKGEIKAERLVVNGLFEGSADCSVVEVLSEGIYIGDVTSEELTIEAKAKFQGQSKLRTQPKNEILLEPIVEHIEDKRKEKK